MDVENGGRGRSLLKAWRAVSPRWLRDVIYEIYAWHLSSSAGFDTAHSLTHHRPDTYLPISSVFQDLVSLSSFFVCNADTCRKYTMQSKPQHSQAGGPAARQYGTSGRAVKVVSNTFAIKSLPTQTIYHYDGEFAHSDCVSAH